MLKLLIFYSYLLAFIILLIGYIFGYFILKIGFNLLNEYTKIEGFYLNNILFYKVEDEYYSYHLSNNNNYINGQKIELYYKKNNPNSILINSKPDITPGLNIIFIGITIIFLCTFNFYLVIQNRVIAEFEALCNILVIIIKIIN
jgi:hypothetical protein